MIVLYGVSVFFALCLWLTSLDAAGVAGNCPNMCSGHGSCDKFARYSLFLNSSELGNRCFTLDNIIIDALVKWASKRAIVRSAFVPSELRGLTKQSPPMTPTTLLNAPTVVSVIEKPVTASAWRALPARPASAWVARTIATIAAFANRCALSP